jgi:hypothetical protein
MAFGVHWGPGGQTTTTCKEVTYDLDIKCDNDACDWKRDDQDSILITPTKVGELRVHATMNPTGLRRTKKISLPPVQIVTPDSATADCYVWHDDSTRVNVGVQWKGRDIQHGARPTIAGMESCIGNTSMGDEGGGMYRCKPLQRSIDVTMASTGYAVSTKASCPVVLPAWDVLRDGDTTQRFQFESPYRTREDHVKLTLERLDRWGWKADSTTVEATATTIVTSKLDTTVEIVIADVGNPVDRQFSWSWKTLNGAAIGTHQLPGWRAMLSPGY